MGKRTGADAVVEVCEANGVECVFGLCGHTVVAVLAALEHSRIRFVGVHHEQTAAHAADGYARVTGRPQVVLCHLGPGMTNALTGVANASLDDIPMVVLAGNVQSYFRGRHAHMETMRHADADQARAYAPWCKRVWRVEQARYLVPALDAAFAVASTGRPGPVLVDVAMDVFSAELGDDPYLPRPRPEQPGALDSVAAVIAEELIGAERPVLYAGEEVGRHRAGDLLMELAEELGAPVAYGLMAKGAVPDAHPLCCGMSGFWGTPEANAACRDATLLFAVGANFSELDSSSWEPGVTFSIPPTRLIHSHGDPEELGRSYVPTIAVESPPRPLLAAVLAEVRQRGGRPGRLSALPDELVRLRERFRSALAAAQSSDEVPLRPERVLAEVERQLEQEEVVLVGDTGWNKNGVGQQVSMRRPRQFIAAGGYSTMGFGPAAALGVALAAPDCRVLALVGDGAFLANPSVVVTAVEEGIPVVWAVMNNGTYATISGMELRHFGTEYGSSFDATRIDYAGLARAVGAQGERITEASQLGPVLARALASRSPFVIDIPCTRDNVPTTGRWEINELFESGRSREGGHRD